MADLGFGMSAVFELSLSGEGIYPESIRASELAEILKSIEKTVTSIAVQKDPSLNLDEFIVGLVQISKSSAKLAFASSKPSIAKSSFENVSKAVSEGKVYTLPNMAIEEIGKIADFSKKKGCIIAFRPDLEKEPLAFIEPDIDLGLQKIPTYSGDTVIFGKLERIGGATPKARLRISDREVVSCTLTHDLAKSLATKLYEHVGLSGKATWNSATWAIVSFNVQSISHYRGGSIKEAFQELSETAGDAWSDVQNLTAYIRSLREE
jgi:hypothetical protein